MAGLFERGEGSQRTTQKASPAQQAVARFLLARLANPPSFAGHVSGHHAGPDAGITADLMNVLLQPGSMDRTTEGTVKPPGASIFEQAMQGLQGLMMINALVRGGTGTGVFDLAKLGLSKLDSTPEGLGYFGDYGGSNASMTPGGVDLSGLNLNSYGGLNPYTDVSSVPVEDGGGSPVWWNPWS